MKLHRDEGFMCGKLFLERVVAIGQVWIGR